MSVSPVVSAVSMPFKYDLGFTGKRARVTSLSTLSSVVKVLRSIPSIDKGIREALENGVICWLPSSRHHVTLVKWFYHEVDL